MMLLAVGRKITARRAAAAGADELRLAGGQRLLVDLIERIVLRHGLIDDRLAVGREIAFAGFHEIGRHLADVGRGIFLRSTAVATNRRAAMSDREAFAKTQTNP